MRPRLTPLASAFTELRAAIHAEVFQRITREANVPLWHFRGQLIPDYTLPTPPGTKCARCPDNIAPHSRKVVRYEGRFYHLGCFSAMRRNAGRA